MFQHSTLRVLQRSAWVGVCLAADLASAAPYSDGNGKLWRQLTDTLGVTWAQASAVCPSDGITPCSGWIADVDMTGWVWSGQSHVMRLLNDYMAANSELPDDGLLSLQQPKVGGRDYYDVAASFINSAMDPTNSHSTDYSFSHRALGWTSDVHASGDALRAFVGYRSSSVSLEGIFQVADRLDPSAPSADTGFWLWRDAVSIPEPQGALLLGAGLAMLMLRARLTRSD